MRYLPRMRSRPLLEPIIYFLLTTNNDRLHRFALVTAPHWIIGDVTQPCRHITSVTCHRMCVLRTDLDSDCTHAIISYLMNAFEELLSLEVKDQSSEELIEAF